ncbi:hypothetical protein AVEN_140217-1 [Araneus ventricosus]|uniref:Peptidase A2 domain-containing protein n=1 Tax=Araneus ventricosus TaxID=182803 RepID=A0A4Y2I855_ARAVE|nr:hypothetical protein AVEN_140217-1 [Araneus ventricosus]
MEKNTKGRKVSLVEEENFLSPASPVCLAINNRSESQSETTWFQELSMEKKEENKNGNLVNFKLDSGAQVNVLPFELLQNWENIPRIKTNARPILYYSNNQVPIISELILTIKNKDSSSKCKFLITSLKSSLILGLNSCLKLKLIKRICQLEGKLKKVVKIHLKDDYTPSMAAARKIPLALHDKVKAELNRMVNIGVITKVEQPTE